MGLHKTKEKHPALRMIRVTWCLTALVVAVVAACGCASSARMSHGGDEMSVEVYGRQINLRHGDVPGFVALRFPKSGRVSHGPFGVYVEKCDGVQAHNGDLRGIASKTFEDVNRAASSHGNLFPMDSVQSAVYVMESPALAYREVLAAVSPRGQECLVAGILKNNPSFSSEGASAGPILSALNTSSRQFKLLGTHIYEVKISGNTRTETARPNGVPNYSHHLFAFVVGRVLVVINTVGSPKSFSRLEERRVLLIVVARSHATK